MTENTEAKKDNSGFPRRRMLAAVTVALGGLGAAVAGIPVLGFVIGKMFRKPVHVWRRVGSVEGFEQGTTVPVMFDNVPELPWDGVSAHTAAWLRRVSEEKFIAFSVNCTHLGCPVQWKPDANLFMCPCHGGVYYADGAVAGGPPPEPLPRYRVRIRDGQVEILTEPIPIAVASGSRQPCRGGLA